MSGAQIIIAILVPSVVAVVSVLSAARVSHQALDHQRRISDLDAARSLLDSAGDLLRRTTELVIDIRNGFDRYGHGLFRVEAIRDGYDELVKVQDELSAQSMRLDIRLGPAHPSGLAFEMASVAVNQICRTLSASRRCVGLTAVRSAEDRENMERATGRYFGEAATFIVSAHQTVGARLPGVDHAFLEGENGEPVKQRRLLRPGAIFYRFPSIIVSRRRNERSALPF